MTNIFYSLLYLFGSLMANYGSSYLLSNFNLSQQPANDILLMITPRIQWMGYVADSILIITTGILFFSLRKKLNQIPFIIYSISAVLFVRSFLVLLTPVNNSFGGREYWDLFSFSKYPSGMFPSGHTAFTYLCYLFLKDNSNKIYAKISMLLLISEIIALITSHGHYSIDIIGGLMLAYIIYRLGKDFQKKSSSKS